MNERQKANLETVGPMYKAGLERAYEATCSPRAAIKAFCLHCTGYDRWTITNCTSQTCPLLAFRPFQKAAENGPETPEAED